MDDPTYEAQLAKIRGYERGYRATHVINLGGRLGLLKSLSEKKEGRTVPELSQDLGLYEPFVKIWCLTAYHFEILDCDEAGRFRIQPHLDRVFGLPAQAKRVFETPPFKTVLEAGTDPGLMEYFRTGKPVASEKTPESSIATAAATQGIHLVFLHMIFPRFACIRKALEEGVRFLDIGCGGAGLIIELAKTFPRSRFLGVDPDVYAVHRARAAIDLIGLSGRVMVEPISGENLSFRDAFHMASMVVTLHEIPPDVRCGAVKGAHRALIDGGRILILDFPYPERIEDFRNPIYTQGIIEQYFEAAEGTVHLTARQQDELLSSAGFHSIQRAMIAGGMFEFVIAEK